MRYFLGLLFTCTFGISKAQTNDYQFVVKKIIANYSGFNDKTDSVKFLKFANKVIAQNSNDTFKALSIIVNSFKDKHLTLLQAKPNPIINLDSCKKDFLETTDYLNGALKKKKYEGYWLNDYNDCVIGIIQTNTSPLKYKAYIVEAIDTSFIKGLLLLSFEKQMSRNTFFAEGIGLYSKRRLFRNAVFRDDSVFTLEELAKWKKINFYKEHILKSLPQFNYFVSSKQMNDSTYLFKISGSTPSDYQIIDSTVKADYSKIKNSKTLIIDLTNNLGGSSSVIFPLLPFLYTQPITKHQTSFYSSEDNVNAWVETLEEYKQRGNPDTAYLRTMNEWINYWRQNYGHLIPNYADTIGYDSVYPKPKNVGVIMNYACQSASELMILMCKQSSKATLFGEHTMGAADYLDFSPTPTPSKKYNLYIATSKRVIPENGSKIDGIGLYPDVPISDTVEDWQKFVVKYYEKH